MARPSLHLPKCQIVGNLMPRLNYNSYVLFSVQLLNIALSLNPPV